jgi:hypothetical protein
MFLVRVYGPTTETRAEILILSSRELSHYHRKKVNDVFRPKTIDCGIAGPLDYHDCLRIDPGRWLVDGHSRGKYPRYNVTTVINLS